MAELIWDGKYDEHGHKRVPVRIELPFQTVETVNESVQERQRTLELSSSGNDPEWRNRLIWGDKKGNNILDSSYVLCDYLTHGTKDTGRRDPLLSGCR